MALDNPGIENRVSSYHKADRDLSLPATEPNFCSSGLVPKVLAATNGQDLGIRKSHKADNTTVDNPEISQHSSIGPTHAARIGSCMELREHPNLAMKLERHDLHCKV